MDSALRTIALVTGANRLGLATASALAETGCTVLLAGRDPEAVHSAVTSLRRRGLDVAAVIMDVSSLTSVAAAAQDVRERYGRLDVLVNNAGILPEASADGVHDFMEPGVLQQTFQTSRAADGRQPSGNAAVCCHEPGSSVPHHKAAVFTVMRMGRCGRTSFAASRSCSSSASWPTVRCGITSSYSPP